MEQTELYQFRLNALKKAFSGFSSALEIDTNALDSKLTDVIKCGHVQKFEYCTELLWKTLKLWLILEEITDVNSPKAVIKAYYRTANLPEDLYQELIKVIHHRNLYSHVYNEEEFEKLYAELPLHAITMSRTIALLSKK